jgi:hypothetical protein
VRYATVASLNSDYAVFMRFFRQKCLKRRMNIAQTILNTSKKGLLAKAFCYGSMQRNQRAGRSGT